MRCAMRAFRRDTSEHLLSRSDKTDELLMTLMTARDDCRRLIRRGTARESRGPSRDPPLLGAHDDRVFLWRYTSKRYKTQV